MQPEATERAAEIRQQIQSDPVVLGSLQDLLEYLPYCEFELIQYMVGKGVWSGTIPSPPPGYKTGDGTVELGLVLYWMKNWGELDLSMFTPKEQIEIIGLIIGLDFLLPSSQMTPDNANFFKTNELIYLDGGVLSAEKWATYDQGWFIAVLNMIQSIKNNLWYFGEKLPLNPPPVITLNGAVQGTIKIAVIGDCGTGDTTLQQLMQQVTGVSPDYIIHVGDVYYAGTPQANSPNGNFYFYPGEEVNNMNNCWPAGYNGRSFTLNSNHEMYSGAIGYFHDALGVNNLNASPIFTAQKGSSFFFLKVADWTLACLDTAYQSSVTNAFMDGSIGLPTDTQTVYLQQQIKDPSRTILFTHHTGFAADCSEVYPLWNEIRTALNGDPYAWYWGHVHNGIVYNRTVQIPVAAPTFRTNTYARCLGHAALPYGFAQNLVNKQITWMERNQKPNSSELYNGWALLTFVINNNSVRLINEAFYDLSQANPVYSQTIFSR